MKCPFLYIPNGYVDYHCFKVPGSTCRYFCSDGYRATHSRNSSNIEFEDIRIGRVQCTTSATWESPLNVYSLCEKVRCPSTIPNGIISTGCIPEYNRYCRYSCNNGFIRTSSKLADMVCTYDGQWLMTDSSHSGSQDACRREYEVCPASIQNGSVDRYCIRTDGKSSSFTCDAGCKRISNVTSLTCTNGTWDHNTDLLCTDCQRCSLHIPNGWIVSKNCNANTDCDYECSSTYEKNTNVTKLSCSETNEWGPTTNWSMSSDLKKLCIPLRCPSEIPNGRILYTKTCKTPIFRSVCGVECGTGYKRNITNVMCKDSFLITGGWEMHWTVDGSRVYPHTFCINSSQCPVLDLPHASLEASCTRNPGDVCSYECDEGYRLVNQ